MESVDQQSTTRRLVALPRARLRMEFQFAVLSAVGGVVLGAGDETTGLSMLAILMALFGFLFVDWLRLVELPPTGAYLAMGGAAAYCVRDFWWMQGPGETQMVSVATLLVLVQGILMLQRKSRRILEQLTVFCLLELVVAAIFNDAIIFGLLLIPIAMIGASALSLLGLVSTMECIDVTLDRELDPPPKTRWQRFKRWVMGHPEPAIGGNRFVSIASPDSAVSLYRSARPWSRYVVMTLAPAVLAVAAAFFYVLPRKVEAERSSAIGAPLVGFDDEVRLEQLGQVMQNPKIALKVELSNAVDDRPYRIDGSLYLRGKVLENYELAWSRGRAISKWTSSQRDSISRRDKLPYEFQPHSSRAGERALYDQVNVAITCERMSRSSLFAIAPYYASGTATDVVHAVDRWTLSRDYQVGPFPRMSYRFGTHAFFEGKQSRWIARASAQQRLLLPFEGVGSPRFLRDIQRFDQELMPTAARFAEEVADTIPLVLRTQSRVAKEFEQFLANDPRFSYTLKLDAKPEPGVDPIEQFLAKDRRGHCQYFASALAMMLRSVGIPSRVVVGYRTEEYSRVSEHYVARQQHAHAWVEALIDRDDLPAGVVVAGQKPSTRYWMRLDPTPGASVDEDRRDGNVEGIIDIAQDIWEDFVVDMDGQQQSDNLVDAAGLGDARNAYQVFLQSIESAVGNLRAGRLGGGELSMRGRMPLKSIAIAVAILLAGCVIVRLRFPSWIRIPSWISRKRPKPLTPSPQTPVTMFYAETLQQLQRVGIKRRSDETPRELARRAGAAFPSLHVLTIGFEDIRYGGSESSNTDHLQAALEELRRSIDIHLTSS